MSKLLKKIYEYHIISDFGFRSKVFLIKVRLTTEEAGNHSTNSATILVKSGT